MTDQPPRNITIKGRIDNNSGNAQIGFDNEIDDTDVTIGSALSAEELVQLRAAFEGLREQVAREAPADMRERALERVDELEQATGEPEPDVSVMAAAARWFKEHIPTVVGAVTSVIINPIVGKAVQSAGDAIVDEYRRKFPDAAPPSQP